MKAKTREALHGLQFTPLLSTLMLTAGQIDATYTKVFTKTGSCQRGGMRYYYPTGWTGLGLKVAGKYDDGDNMWLNASKGVPPEWAVGFYGLHNSEAAKGIVTGCFVYNGQGQAYSNAQDVRTGEHCGYGAYLTPHIEVAEQLCWEIKLKMSGGDKTFCVAMQCRVNPAQVKIPIKESNLEKHKKDPEWQNDYWIVNSPNDARPYRILFKEITPTH